MKRRQGERRILAVSLCGLALMLAYFGIRTVPMSRLTPLSPAVGTDAVTREVTTPGVRIDINTAGLEDEPAKYWGSSSQGHPGRPGSKGAVPLS